MDYDLLTDEEQGQIREEAAASDPDAEVIAALQREHLQLASLPESQDPEEQRRRTDRLAEIEAIVAAKRGEG